MGSAFSFVANPNEEQSNPLEGQFPGSFLIPPDSEEAGIDRTRELELIESMLDELFNCPV